MWKRPEEGNASKTTGRVETAGQDLAPWRRVVCGICSAGSIWTYKKERSNYIDHN